MKKLASRLFALLMAVVMIFSFAACGGDNDTTEPESTTKAEEVDASVEETSGTEESTEDTSATDDTDVSATEDNDDVTTKAPVKISAPVNGSTAQIVKFYNDYANATKAYKGTVKIKKTEGRVSKLTKFLGEGKAKDLASGMLEDATGGSSTKTKTFTNGKCSDGDSLVKFLPPSKRTTMSTLTANGVKSATCTAVNGGWKVVIKLKQEKVGFNEKPTAHDSCIDILEIAPDDVKPFTINTEATEFNYKGGTIEAVINSSGLLTSLKISEPVYITTKLKWLFSIDTEIDGGWNQDIAFTY